ncbi:DUF4340 domain-containing protein [Candidatus Parcubacteria bacterium]|nr:DUF4340 domain-containing protein [Candidatus Parcubacteria bacterium]
MITKKNYKLITVFAVLLIAAYFIKIAPWANHKSEVEAIFSELNASEIDRVEIAKDEKNIILEKKNDLWVVASSENFKAEQERAGSIITQIVNAEQLALVSENPEKQPIYQVKDKYTRVKFFTSDNLKVDFFIGKSGDSYNTNYLRMADSNSVYLINVDLNALFADLDFRDKQILKITKESIDKLEFVYPKSEILLEKNENIWKVKTGKDFTANQKAVDEILNLASNLQAQDIAVDKNLEGSGLDSPELKLTIYSGENKNVLLLGKEIVEKSGEEEVIKGRYAKLEDSGIIYIIYKYAGEQLIKELKDFQE